jgi:hypothetical protein
MALSCALVSRETTLLLMPATLLLLRAAGRPALWAACGAALVLYAAAIAVQPAWRTGQAVHAPWLLGFNLGSAAMRSETIGYFIMVLGLPLFLVLRWEPSGADKRIRALRIGFWLTLLLNTALVLGAAKAREARLFALPLLLLWPLAGMVAQAEADRAGGWTPWLRKAVAPIHLALIASAGALAAIAAHRWFVLSTGIPQDNPFHESLIATAALMAAVALAGRRPQPRVRRSSKLRPR